MEPQSWNFFNTKPRLNVLIAQLWKTIWRVNKYSRWNCAYISSKKQAFFMEYRCQKPKIFLWSIVNFMMYFGWLFYQELAPKNLNKLGMAPLPSPVVVSTPRGKTSFFLEIGVSFAVNWGGLKNWSSYTTKCKQQQHFAVLKHGAASSSSSSIVVVICSASPDMLPAREVPLNFHRSTLPLNAASEDWPEKSRTSSSSPLRVTGT